MCAQPKKFAKPAVADVYGFLRGRDALIIHFSGPKGSEARPERLFPADLRNVIAGGAMGGLSCCVMGAGDNFEKHSWGSIGVVLGFKNKDSLVAANPHDCGSMDDMIDGKIVRTVHREKDLSVPDLESTMDKRISHNEWVVRDYVVLGIFAYPPCLADEVAGQTRQIRIRELLELFPEQPIFSFRDRAIHRLWPRPIGLVDHSDIYQLP
jgi:hypothetical protein